MSWRFWIRRADPLSRLSVVRRDSSCAKGPGLTPGRRGSTTSCAIIEQRVLRTTLRSHSRCTYPFCCGLLVHVRQCIGEWSKKTLERFSPCLALSSATTVESHASTVRISVGIRISMPLRRSCRRYLVPVSKRNGTSRRAHRCCVGRCKLGTSTMFTRPRVECVSRSSVCDGRLGKSARCTRSAGTLV